MLNKKRKGILFLNFILIIFLAVSCGGGSSDSAGEEPVTDPPTGGETDIIPPSVLSTSPTNNQKDVPYTCQVSAIFSEPIDCDTVSDKSFFVRKGTINIPGTVGCSNDSATFTPNAYFEGLTDYSAIINTTIEDVNGNRMKSNKVWYFTTGKQPDVTPPTPGNAGLIQVLDNGSNYVSVNWTAATDNDTPSSNLQYQVYKSANDNISTPDEAKQNGTPVGGLAKNLLQQAITGLNPSSKIFINVLIKDESGNENCYNRIEVTTKRPPICGVKYGFSNQYAGSVFSLAKHGNTLYLGGEFNLAGKHQSYGCVFDMSTHTTPYGFTAPNITGGSVYTAVPDGQGGWYIGGDFTHIYGIYRKYVARINADGSLHPWYPSPNGYVKALHVINNTLYVAGGFTRLGSPYRYRIASFDLSTGLENAFYPTINSVILTVTSNGEGSVLYIGGYFTTINGETRNYIAALDPVTGNLKPWNPNASWEVFKIVLSNDEQVAYVAGNFSSIGGANRNYLAAVGIETGLATDWNPNPSSWVHDIQLNSDGSLLYIGGGFGSILGTYRPYLAVCETATGLIAPWESFFNDAIYSVSLLSDDTGIFVAGDFTRASGDNEGGLTSGNNDAYGIALVSTDTGNVISRNQGFDKRVNVVKTDSSAGRYFVGGEFTMSGCKYRPNIAAVDITTGELTSWAPKITSDGTGKGVNTLALNADGTKIYVGGDIHVSGDVNRNKKFGIIDTTTGIASYSKYFFDDGVYSIKIDHANNILYAAGGFKNALYYNDPWGWVDIDRNGLAAIDLTTGELTSWSPSADNTVRALELDLENDRIFIGGEFSKIGSTDRKALAAISASTGVLLDWNTNTDDTVYCLSLDTTDGLLYVGGRFSHAGGEERNRVAAISTTTGAAHSWNPSVSNIYNQGEVISIQPNIDYSLIYIGGYFTQVGTVTIRDIAAVEMPSGAVASWAAASDVSEVDAILLDETNGLLFRGGRYFTSGSLNRNNLTAIDLTSGYVY